MRELKEKVLGDMQGFLDGRLAGRLKPKAAAPKAAVPEFGEGEEQAAVAGIGEGETEGSEGGLDEKVEAMGGDISRLSPEEKAELEQLYDKMGC